MSDDENYGGDSPRAVVDDDVYENPIDGNDLNVSDVTCRLMSLTSNCFHQDDDIDQNDGDDIDMQVRGICQLKQI
jgi:hypothetical protein